jgi:hypothetical protein
MVGISTLGRPASSAAPVLYAEPGSGPRPAVAYSERSTAAGSVRAARTAGAVHASAAAAISGADDADHPGQHDQADRESSGMHVHGGPSRFGSANMGWYSPPAQAVQSDPAGRGGQFK